MANSCTSPTPTSGVGGSKFTPAVEWKRENEGILLEFIAMKQLQGEFELEKWPGTNLRDNQFWQAASAYVSQHSSVSRTGKIHDKIIRTF